MNTKITKISINGQILNPAEAAVSALDEGLTHGIAAFETLRISDNKVFLLPEHFDRLFASLKALKISLPDDRNTYWKWIGELAGFIDERKDGRIRFMVTAGDAAPNVIIFLSEIEKSKFLPARAKILSSLHRQPPDYLETTGFRIKAPDYIAASLAAAELSAGEEGILLNSEGYIAEALTSNIFWVKDGQVYTPPLSLGVLPGIIRDYVIKNYDAKEKLIKHNQLKTIDEIFLTNSINFIVPINKIDDHECSRETDISLKIFDSIV